MPKILMVDIDRLLESVINQKTEQVFDDAMSIVEKNGVCYFRFTANEGMSIIHPRFNKAISGVIADA